MLLPIVRRVALVALLPTMLLAQSPKQLKEAGALITPAKVLQRISVIAHDSMGGRNTPSPGLEKTAQFLADSYKAWGLKPAGDNGTYFQRYPMVKKRVDPVASYFEANEGGQVTRYAFGPMTYGSGATATAVRELMEADPSIQAQVFAFDLHEFRVFYPGCVSAPARRT